MLVALLIVGGAIGAPARYLADGFVQSRTRGVLPWGTFAINVSGSLLLGFLTGLTIYHGLGPLPKVALGTGFCGAYTTFSTFSYETMRLVEEGSVPAALLNVSVSVIVGLLAAGAGLALAAAW
jgi:fluoride exporter